MPKITACPKNRVRSLPGFSLIELIIVILIASLFAALTFNNVVINAKKEKKVGIKHLKEAFGKKSRIEGELICTDKCSKCSFVSSSGTTSEISSSLKELKAYMLDDNGNPGELDFGRIKDRKVCLRFRYYANGSNSQMIIESEDRYYFVPSYFGDVEVFEDMESAVSRWTRYRDQVNTMGTYY